MTTAARPTPYFALAVPDGVAALVQSASVAERRGDWQSAREWYRRAIARPEAASDPAQVARFTRLIARSHLNEADFDAAIDCLEVARATSEAADDLTGLAHALNLHGLAESQRGNLEGAEARYVEARAIADRVGARAVVAMIDQNMGILANIRGDFPSARARYQASLAAYDELGMAEKVGPLLNNLGMLHTDLGEWRAAEQAFSQALSRSFGANDVPGLLQAQANRVELYLHLRRFKKAKRVCRDILTRMSGGVHGQWIGETYKHLGVIDRETGNLGEAADHLRRALAESERRNDPLLTAETLRELAQVHRAEGRTQEMLTALNRSHEIFTSLSARRDLSDIDKRLRTLETSFLEIVGRWGSSIESKDRYTQGHCERVADFGCIIAEDAGVAESELLWFRMGGLLHDVGKVMVPEEVLNKAGKLSPEEWELMKEHPAAGERLVADANFPLQVLPMIRHHHERWDGNGYPDRLAGEATPFWARILCISDVWDALTTTRSYRKAFTAPEAVTIMKADSGRAFDPALLDTFLEKSLPRILASRPRLSRPGMQVVSLVV